MKVSVGFVSPENVHRCIRLVNEIRALPQHHRAKKDILEVYDCFNISGVLRFLILFGNCTTSLFSFFRFLSLTTIYFKLILKQVKNLIINATERAVNELEELNA